MKIENLREMGQYTDSLAKCNAMASEMSANNVIDTLKRVGFNADLNVKELTLLVLESLESDSVSRDDKVDILIDFITSERLDAKRDAYEDVTNRLEYTKQID